MKKLKKLALIAVLSLFSAAVFAVPGAPGGGKGPGGAPSRPSRQPPSRSSKGSSQTPSERASSSKAKTEPSESSEEKKQVLNYRGARVLSDDGDFNFSAVKTQRSNTSEVSLEITFSQSVNPHSFSASSIFIDGKPIPAETKFSFNKKGDTIKFSVPETNGTFSLTIQHVESFDGTVLETVEIENLTDNFGGK